MVELRGLVAGNEQCSIIAVVGRHQRAGDFQCGLVAGTAAGVDRGGEGARSANLFLNLSGSRPGGRDVIFGNAGEVDDQVNLFGIDARLGHSEFGRVDAEVGSRLVFCDVKGLNADVFLKVDIGGESFSGLFFIFEDLRQGFLSWGQIVVGFENADVRIHKSVSIPGGLTTEQAHCGCSTHAMRHPKHIVSLLYAPALDQG